MPSLLDDGADDGCVRVRVSPARTVCVCACVSSEGLCPLATAGTISSSSATATASTAVCSLCEATTTLGLHYITPALYHMLRAASAQAAAAAAAAQQQLIGAATGSLAVHQVLQAALAHRASCTSCPSCKCRVGVRNFQRGFCVRAPLVHRENAHTRTSVRCDVSFESQAHDSCELLAAREQAWRLDCSRAASTMTTQQASIFIYR